MLSGIFQTITLILLLWPKLLIMFIWVLHYLWTLSHTEPRTVTPKGLKTLVRLECVTKGLRQFEAITEAWGLSCTQSINQWEIGSRLKAVYLYNIYTDTRNIRKLKQDESSSTVDKSLHSKTSSFHGEDCFFLHQTMRKM